MDGETTYLDGYILFSLIFGAVALGLFSLSALVYFTSEKNKSEFEKEKEKNDVKLSHIFAWIGFALILFSSPVLIYMVFKFFRSLKDKVLKKAVSDTTKKVNNP
jgi:hypothetical protein